MEVLIPVQSIDFDFNTAQSLPFLSAPSTPKRFGHYYFTTPSEDSQILYDLDEFSIISNTPKTEGTTSLSPSNPNHGNDFAFDVTTESGNTSVSAEELFDGGKIRPLRPQTQPRISRERGRTRTDSVYVTKSDRGDRGARSVSPRRVSKYPWEVQEEEEQKQSSVTGKQSIAPVTSLKGCRKWKLKDFFLFRSKSEGHGGKHTDLFRKHEGVIKKDGSFRVLEGSSGKRGRVSAHELHYTVNRAASEDLKKKTFLPYKQGILGRLAFNPTIHALANGFGFSSKS